jgi:predicted transcriptional regulator
VTEDLSGLPAIERARRAAELIEHHRALVGHYAGIRADAVAEARADGVKAHELAAALGVTRAAITKLRQRASR